MLRSSSGKRPQILRGVKWNRECSAALTIALTSHGPERHTALNALHITVARAKQNWTQGLLDGADNMTDLWTACNWRKGRRAKAIPPLLCNSDLFDLFFSQFSVAVKGNLCMGKERAGGGNNQNPRLILGSGFCH